jgi:hypothetical protein
MCQAILFSLILLSVIGGCGGQIIDRTLVQLSYGAIRGEVPIWAQSYVSCTGRFITTKSGARGYGYFDLPYALPPIGEYRFRPPRPLY